MGDQAFDINKFDWDEFENKMKSQKQPSPSKEGVFDPKSFDWDSFENKMTAQEEVEQRGTISDIISGIVRGVAIEMPGLFLDTAAATERIARKTLGYEQEQEVGPIGEIARAGKESLEGFRAEHPILRAKEKPGIISQGVEAAAMSISSGVPGAAAGFAIGSMFGPASPITAPMGALIGFALSGGVTFGLAEYEGVIQMADEQDIDRAESEPAAIWSGLAEGGFEFASNLFTGGILKVAKPLTAPAKEGLKTGIRQIFKMGLKETMVRGGAVLASETSMEMLTAGVQAEQYRKIGLGDATFWEGAKEAMGPAFVASVIFAGVGTGVTRLHRSSIRRKLENGEIDPEKRMEAAEEVGQVLDQVDKELAATWRTNAFEAISNKENIEIDDPDLIRQTAFTRASQEYREPTPEDIATEEAKVKQEVHAEKQDDIKTHIIAGIATGDIDEKQAHAIGKNVGVDPTEINQSIIHGMDVQRMFEDADPLELKPFAVAQDIDVPASVTDGKQIATIIQEGLKEEGSIVAELAKQVKNLEETATKPGMERAAKNLEKKKAALDKVLPATEEETPVIEAEEDLEVLPEEFEKKVEELAVEPEKEAEGDREAEGRLAPIQPEEGLKGEAEAPGRAVPEPKTGREEGKPSPVLEGKEEIKAAEIDAAATEAATSPENDLPEPTEAQKEAGNYKKGHVSIQGMDITIENPEGSKRSGTDKDGKKWSVTMQNHYGYFKRSEGKDGDQVDVFIGNSPESQKAFIVDQVDPATGKFDEHKTLLGFNSEDEARKGYLANYEKGWKGLGNITEVPVEEFKEWIGDGTKKTIPFAKTIKAEKPEKVVYTGKTEELKEFHRGDPDGPKKTFYEVEVDGKKRLISTPPEKAPEARTPEVVEGEKAKKPWEITRNDYVQTAWDKIEYPKLTFEQFESSQKMRHKKFVIDALSEGKPVPTEALKDYPDLKPTPAPEKTDVAPEGVGVEAVKAVKAKVYKSIDRNVFKDIVSKTVQNDGQKLLDALDSNNTQEIKRIAIKYAKDVGRDQGGVGAGPGKVKQAKPGAAVLGRMAGEALDVMETAKAKPVKKPKVSTKGKNIRSLRGAIKDIGGINFLNFKGELKEMPTAVKFLSRKTGIPIDDAVRQLREDGWLDKDATVTSFLEDLRTNAKTMLSRDRIGRDIAEKKESELTEEEKRLKKEMAREPEEPPKGKYETMAVDDLKDGSTYTIIEGRTKDGWDEYKIHKTEDGVTLEDGEIIELEPWDKVQVLKEDLPKELKKPPTEQPELVKVKPKMFGEPEKVAEVKTEKSEKLAALDKVEREASSEFKQDKLFEPKQKPLFSFAGTKARTADKSTLGKASQMESQGKDMEAIRKETGWFLDVDNKWKFEIDDSAVRIRDKGKGEWTTLGDAVKHPKLFQAYPELKDVELKLTIDEDLKAADGSLNAGPIGKYKTAGMEFEETYSDWQIFARAPNMEDAKNTILHEIQHAVQAIEGFARGGNLRTFSYAKKYYINGEETSDIEGGKGVILRYWEHNKELKGLEKEFKTTLREWKQRLKKAKRLKTKAEYQEKVTDWEEAIRLLPEAKDWKIEFKSLAFEKYYRLAGEVEARETSLRKNLTPQQRKIVPPYLDGIPREDVIVRFDRDRAQYQEEAAPKSKADKVFETVLPYLQGMANFPTVRVVQSIDQLPKQLKAKVTAFSKQKNKQVEGFYDKEGDQVFLIADNLSEGRIEAVLRHEAEGHRGIRLLLGSDLDGFLDGVARAKKNDLLAHDPGLDFKDQEAARVAADEWIARKIEAGNLGKSFWDDLVRIFRKWLRKIVPNLDLTDREIRSVLVDTIKNVREGRIDRIRESEGMPLFSTAKAKPIEGQYIQTPGAKTPGVEAIFGKKKNTVKETVTEGYEKVKTKEFWDTVITKGLDRLHPVRTMIGEKAYQLHRVETGLQATFSMFMKHGKLSWDKSGFLRVDESKKGFIPFLDSLGKDWNKFFYWVAARRAEELEVQGREKWLTKEKRDEIYKWTGGRNNPKWTEANKELKEFNKNVLDIATKAGLVNAEERAVWEQEFYVPFYRIFEDEQIKNEYLKGPRKKKKYISAQIRRLTGAEMKPGEPLENLMHNWMHLISESLRNVARAEAYDFSIKTNNKLVTPAKTSDVKSFYYSKEKKMVYVHNKTSEEVLMFQREGKPVYFKVHDPELYNALSGIDTWQHDKWLQKIMGIVIGSKRALTYGATFGPAFRVANLLRDTMHTAMLQKSFTPFISSAKGFIKSMRENDEYIAFMASGAGFGSSYVRADDPKVVTKYINRILKREGQGAVDRILRTPIKMLDYWDKIGSASENAARVQLYSNLIGEGKTHREAAFEARDLLDFTMTGQSNVVRLLIQTIPFLNARMQGNYKLVRAAIDENNRKNFVFRGSMLMAASLALWFFNKDEEEYKELEDWDKWAYYHWWIGDKHYRLPKPFEVGALFSSLPESIMDVLYGNEETKHIANFIGHTTTQTFAIGFPQIVKPAIEQWANKSFFTDRPIIGERLKGLPPSQQKDPWTSETMQILAGKMGISPKRAEELVRGYFSVFGMTLLSGADFATRNIFDFPEKPLKKINDYPLAGRFIRAKAPARYTKYQNWFYETLIEINQLSRAFNEYKKTGEYESARELKKANIHKFQYRKRFNRYRNKLGQINRRMRMIMINKHMNPSEKRLAIDGLMIKRNRLVKKIYDIYRDKA